MIETNGKLYDHCGNCGKLVRINKLFFGSLHVCSGRHLEQDWESRDRRLRKRNRAVLREALRIASLPADGKSDDEFCNDEECGIVVGRHRLCWGDETVFLFDPDSTEPEIALGNRLDARAIAAELKQVASKVSI